LMGLVHCALTVSTESTSSPLSMSTESTSSPLSIRPNLTLSHEGDVLSGTLVTLTCTLNVQSTGWMFYWTTPTQSTETRTEEYYSTFSYYHYYYHYYSHYNISSINVSDGGQYMCRAGRGFPVYYTQYSDALWVNVTESPKPVVIITPDTEVFRGERVTLRCNIQTGGTTEWAYEWYRDGYTFYPHSTAQEFTDTDYYYYSSVTYTCRGTRRRDSQLSQISDAVTLSVSDRPKPQLTSSHKGDALTGNSVTLTCALNLSPAGWTFYWNTSTLIQSNATVTAGYYANSSYYHHYDSHYNTRSVNVSDGGQYRCRAGRGHPVYYTHYSDDLSLSVIESPKPVVIIKPDTRVFSGQRVTFRCNIEGGGTTEWTYEWRRDGYTFYPYSTAQEFTVTDYYYYSSSKYTCRGSRNDSQLSQISDAVTLSVSEKPKPDLTSDLKGAALTGNAVTLTCTLKLPSAGWTFYWITPTQSTETETATFHYFLSSVSVSDGGQYRCRAGRGNPVYYTHYSDALWVNVTDESPPVSLIISPSRTQHLTADSLSLSCEEQRDSSVWTVRRYTHSERMSDCSSVSGSTCHICSLSTSHTGVYWCQSESGRRSHSLNITVHNGDVILKSPPHPVTEGNPLTLRCLYRNMKISDSGVYFYKDDSVLQKQTTGEMTISSVSKSDEGFYHCKHPERGESPKSWVSVRVFSQKVSTLKVIWSVIVASPYVLVTIILAVKYYRAQ
ncbi:carcinoembryonic antigen-related cell adhesion molecule 5-like, partial [Clarias magur]